MTNDEALNLIDESLRRLKTQYDMFFGGARKLPPTEDKRRLDVLVRELGKNHIRDNAVRFRYNTLLSRYNQFQELWTRQMREREEGPNDYKKRVAALAQETPIPPPTVTSAPPDSYVTVRGNGSSAEMLELFARIVEANRKLGKGASPTLEQVSSMVAKQAEVIRSRYNVKAIAFRVDTVEGKIKLKARPVQE